LRDQNAVARIVAALGDISTHTVVEIGPGLGAITGALAARAKHVVAVELDHNLAIRLRVQFPPEKVTVVEQDVLSFDFEATLAQFGSTCERLTVVGNLPYYITSSILLKLADSCAALDVAILMVQREVADRVAAVPGTRDYGILSATCQMYGPVTPLFTLPPEAFSPPPEVHSTVFRWRFEPRFAELGVREEDYLRCVRMAFAQKRKTLANNLRAAGFDLADITEALNQSGISPQARAETLSINAFAELTKLLAAMKTPAEHSN
jgi:16S rRNA (adenine1518-N6/adenine1519-N6)-dimethyltransferase